MFQAYGEIYQALGPNVYLGLCGAIAAAWVAIALRRA